MMTMNSIPGSGLNESKVWEADAALGPWHMIEGVGKEQWTVSRSMSTGADNLPVLADILQDLQLFGKSMRSVWASLLSAMQSLQLRSL